MDYSFKEFEISQLVDLVNKDKIDLNPSYQRNFIWSSDNQQELIDTILKGYPLPNFFFYQKNDGSYEMVDCQQRTKTIYRFLKGDITSSKVFNKTDFKNIDQNNFLKYKIPVVIISNLIGTDSLKEFYVLINKKGVHLNVAEVNKSEFIDTNFLKLANDLLTYQNLINLNLFTEAIIKRMNDRAFIEELLAYLYSGFKDKKKSVEAIFKSDIGDEECQMLDNQFKQTIDKIAELNEIQLISSTRYKQKNDFYTLFSFMHENIFYPTEILSYQYKILLFLDGVDHDGRQFIRPSNDECQALRDYANNCVTQSNSKSARQNRLNFFNAILKNAVIDDNEILLEILTYLSNIYPKKEVVLKEVGEFQLLDIDKL